MNKGKLYLIWFKATGKLQPFRGTYNLDGKGGINVRGYIPSKHTHTSPMPYNEKFLEHYVVIFGCKALTPKDH